MRTRAVLLALLLLPALPAAAQERPPGGTTVDASRGGVTISHGVNSLTIGARAQVRWTLDDREDASGDTAGSGVGSADGPVSAFDVPRLRVTLSGGAFRPWMRYAFQFDLSRTSGEGASKIKDAILEIRPEGRSWRVQAGQFKAPFGLQQLTSSGRLQFVDRAITDAKFNPGRDMGAMFSGTLAASKVGYNAGIFNGAGESNRQNTRAHLLVGRVYVQPLGEHSLAEGSTGRPKRLTLHAGAAVRTGKQIRGRSASGVFEDADSETALGLEFAARWPRLFTTAEYFWSTSEQENPAAGPALDSTGFHAQAGYMLMPDRLELGVLYAQITPDVDVDDADVREIRGVANYYFQGHGLKLQGDVGALGYQSRFGALPARARQGMTGLGSRTRSGAFTDLQIRVQLQLAF